MLDSVVSCAFVPVFLSICMNIVVNISVYITVCVFAVSESL